jgi:hypothetical protein
MIASNVPNDWPDPTAQPDNLLDDALKTTLTALSDDTRCPVTERVASYYDPAKRWAGVTFLELQPVRPMTITVADLHSLNLLNAGIGPLPTRQMLEDGETLSAITAALADVEPEADLRHADCELFEAMENLWTAIWQGCADPWVNDPNPWVTVSKLCARKRPGLFPVRDTVVCEGLRLYGVPGRRRGDHKLDWQVFQHLISHPDVNTALDSLADRVRREHGVRCDQFQLRTLDVALWTWFRECNGRQKA